MIPDILVSLLLVLGVAFGLSRPFIGLFRLNPPESLVAGVGFSLIAAWLYCWAVFTWGAPLAAYGALPILSCIFLVVGRRGVKRLWADPAAQDLAVGQLIVTAWCVTCLSFITSYSGGGWTGDFVEHWERSLYFLRAWPAPMFIDQYEMPARPPFTNVLTAAFLQMTTAGYAHFQVIMTALASLTFLPVGLLASRFGGRSAIRVAAVLVMVSPLFVQNATFPWTKLQASYFILLGIYFFLRVRDADEGMAPAAIGCALCLGAAVVTHYSAGPYVVVLAGAWIALGFKRRWQRGFLRLTLLSAAAGACMLAPWFLWSIHRFGVHRTFLSNTTVSMMQRAPGNPLVNMVLNFRDSLIPIQLRGFHGTLFKQDSSWGALRDDFFLIYQLNPLLALGCVGWLVVVVQAVKVARASARPDVVFWTASLAAIVVLSFATYGDRDHYGIGHICLQSTVLAGVAFLASRWGSLTRGWRAALVTGCVFDAVFGIALQLGVEDFAFDRWLTPGRPFEAVFRSYSGVTQINLQWKIVAHVTYFADILPAPPALVLALMGAILWMALLRTRTVPGTPR
jgi:hypothetical protein